MACDAGAKHLSAVFAGIGCKRILGRADHNRVNRLAVRCIPPAYHSVSTAGQ